MSLRRHVDAPEPEPIWTDLRNRSEDAALALIVSAKVDVFKRNRRIHESKARAWRWSLGSLVLAVALIVAALIAQGDSDGECEQQRPRSAAAPSSTDG